MAPAGKRQLNTFLDEDAYDGLFEFASAHAGNTTAFLNALGRALANSERPPRWLEPVLVEARAISSQRKRRRRD